MRADKQVLTATGLDRRAHGYYSTPRFVADFLADAMLALDPDGRTVFDPCVGHEELLDRFHAAGKRIVSMDVHDFGVHKRARFLQGDFLERYRDRRARATADTPATVPFDYLIANPPYNCHESEYIRARKADLQSLFPAVGALNVYAMFVSALIDLARDGALLGLITLDSFLTARMHRGLRRQILDECAIHLLALCPTDLFRDQRADVRTCLMVLQKGRHHQKAVLTANRPATRREFEAILAGGDFEAFARDDLVLSGDRDHEEIVVGCPPDVKRLFAGPRLGERYPCVAGISTGSDRRHLSREPAGEHRIPFYKNPGSRRFFMQPDGYLRRDFAETAAAEPAFTVRNPQWMFLEGIACSSMGVTFAACHRPLGAAFGVNANIVCEGDELWWLLAYLNSRLATFFVRGVLSRTNMVTPGYIARIPLAPLDLKDRTELARIGRAAHAQHSREIVPDYAAARSDIDRIVFSSAGISRDSRATIERFCADLIRRT